MKSITLNASVESISRITEFVDEALEALHCPMKVQMQIDLAIDELFSNISYYAYQKGIGTATVSVDFDPETRTVSLIFEDNGIPYNPLEKEDPDITLSAKERKVGGLGIFLVKKTMDSMEYERRDDRNIVTIRKKI